jgi:hypothetical protein
MPDSINRSSFLKWLVDPVQPTSDVAKRAYRFVGDRRAWLVPMALGIALLTISLLGSGRARTTSSSPTWWDGRFF